MLSNKFVQHPGSPPQEQLGGGGGEHSTPSCKITLLKQYVLGKSLLFLGDTGLMCFAFPSFTCRTRRNVAASKDSPKW